MQKEKERQNSECMRIWRRRRSKKEAKKEKLKLEKAKKSPRKEGRKKSRPTGQSEQPSKRDLHGLTRSGLARTGVSAPEKWHHWLLHLFMRLFIVHKMHKKMHKSQRNIDLSVWPQWDTCHCKDWQDIQSRTAVFGTTWRSAVIDQRDDPGNSRALNSRGRLPPYGAIGGSEFCYYE